MALALHIKEALPPRDTCLTGTTLEISEAVWPWGLPH